MSGRSKYLMLAVACSLALVLLPGMALANPDPAPTWQDLATADNYGHVTYTQTGNTYTFTVFNDQTGAGNNICGFAVYPTALLNNFVPVANPVIPAGWFTTNWEGPISNSNPTAFGDYRYAFVSSNPDLYRVLPGQSMNSFQFNWIGSTAPTDFHFSVEVCRPSGAFWAQSGPNPCQPVPDASTLILAGSGALMMLPGLRSLRRRTA